MAATANDPTAALLGAAEEGQQERHHPPDYEHMLLGEYDHGSRKGWHPELASWQFMHAFCFVLGGTTFVAGTLALFYPGLDTLSAALYTLGSCGFFFVDVQEFFTFGGAVLRTNIGMSMTGSLLYIIGSAGFFPSVVAFNPLIGIWGFVLGSAFIGWSQLWKAHRIGGGETDDGFRLSNVLSCRDAFTAMGVELSAGVGAWCFFFGTLMYNNGPLDGPGSVLGTVLWIWVAGSCWFTLGSLFLSFRHAVMHVV